MARVDWQRASDRDTARAAPAVIEAEPTTHGWWWTVPRYTPRCSDCSERAAGLVAWNHDEGATLCGVCVPRRGVRPAMSKRAKAYVEAEA